MTDDTKQLLPYGIIGLLISYPLMCVLAVYRYFTNIFDTDDYRTRYFLYVLLAMVPALINTTKPVEISDLGFYAWLYDFAGEKSFVEYFVLIPKEPLYYIYNYILSFLTFGEFRLFVIITTLAMYLPVMFAFDIIIRENKLPGNVAIYASILLLLFPQFFLYTMQIVRQVLAGSVAFYCVVKSIYSNNKIALAGVFLAGFIHASAFIFCFFYVFKLTYRWSFFAKILLFGICGLSFYAILGMVADSSAEGTTLAYAANRALSENSDKVSVGLFPRLVALSIIPLGLLSAYRIHESNFYTFVSVSWIIAGIIILRWNTPLFVLRFMEYAYMYIPICIAIFLQTFNKERLLPLISVGMIFFFCIGLARSDFQFLPISELLYRGVLFYLV